MVLQDIFELSAMLKPEMDAKKPFDLRGFKVPEVLIKKMRNFVKAVKTDPSVPDEELLQQAHMQVVVWTCFFVFSSPAKTRGCDFTMRAVTRENII